ncbi:hypothetical protein GCM10010417_27210 [Streptomyces carpaticus]
MHRQKQPTPVVLTDRLPSTVTVVTLQVHNQMCGVVNRSAARDPRKRRAIEESLAAAGIGPHAIREVLDGVRG